MVLPIMLPITFANLLLCAGVLSVPLVEPGSPFPHGWEQVVRLRHLYAAGPGLHLLISEEGLIQGSAEPTLYSKSMQTQSIPMGDYLKLLDTALQA